MTTHEPGLTLKHTNQWALVSFALVGFIVGYGFNEILDIKVPTPSGDAQPGAVVNAPTPTPTAPPPPAAVAKDVTTDDDPVLGNKNATVTLIEFTDYQCPFCGRHYTQTFDQIKKEYVDTGKIKYAVRDFPLSFHPFAQKASEATECADDQGKFWEMHGKLFTNQQALDEPSLNQYATDIGLDADDFTACLSSGKYATETQKDLSDGQAAGITGTPGFVLIDKNGKQSKISGALPFEQFKVAIDAAL